MPRPLRPYDTIKQAVRQDVAVSKFRVTREQAAELKRIEQREGKDAGLRFLLTVLKSK
jgi:hypothetical protein